MSEFQSLIDDYILYISAARRYAPRTVEIYRDILERYMAFCSPADYKNALRTDMIRTYEVMLVESQSIKSATVSLHMSVLSGFCRRLVSKGILEANPVRMVPRPKEEKRLPQFFRKEGMDTYFKSTQVFGSKTVMQMLSGKPGDKYDLEVYSRVLGRLIISILYGTGIRRSEIISLTRDRTNLQRRVLHIIGKGDKMREVPLTPSLCAEISLYLRVMDAVRIIYSPESPLLLTPSGRALYPMFIDRTVKRELGRIEGIGTRKSPHTLRHTIATELLDEGAPINSIKEMLGHSSLAATQVYTHNSIERLKGVYNNAHPRAEGGSKDE